MTTLRHEAQRRSRRLSASLAAGAIVGGLLMWWAVRNLNSHELLAALRSADWRLVLLAFVTSQMAHVAKGIRWARIICVTANVVTTGVALRLVLFGNAVNVVIPHFGDIARAYYAGRTLGLGSAAMYTSIVLERALDFIAISLLVLLLFFSRPAFVTHESAVSVIIGVLTVFLLLGLLTTLVVGRRWLRSRGGREQNLGEAPELKWRSLIVGVTSTLGLLTQTGHLWRVLFWSAVMWGSVAASIYFSIRAVGIDVGFGSAIVVNAINVVALLLPAAPGHVGTIQASFVSGLDADGVAASLAVAASFIYNLLMTIPILIIGMFCAPRGRHVQRVETPTEL